MLFKTEFEKGCMLILGGAKSGKSRIALEICNGLHGKRVFIATAEALDGEMEERIRRHKVERGSAWLTIEEPMNIVKILKKTDSEGSVILLDCLTLWLSNLFMTYGDDHQSILNAIGELLDRLSDTKGSVVMVSNEIGMSIVPGDPVSRRYRDDLGSMHQRIAYLARKVVVVMAGLPLVLKDD